MATPPADPARAALGRRAEALAAEHLEAQGLRIEARNVRLRSGELDLVADHAGVLVVIEVRARTGPFVFAAATVDAGKQRRLIAAVRELMGSVHWHPRPLRFDVVAVSFALDDRLQPQIDWLPAAFEVGSAAPARRTRRRGWAALASHYLPP